MSGLKFGFGFRNGEKTVVTDPAESSSGRVLAIANQKGGVGKTTTTINLGACLATAKRRVLLIDADPQGNTTSGLGINRKALRRSTYDLLINDASLEDAIMHTKFDNLDLVGSNIELAGAEVELVPMLSRENRLKSTFESVRDHYDYVLIDCPPSLGLLTLNALTAADGVLIPIQCEYYALEGYTQLMNTINLVQKHLNPELAVAGVVLTMFDARTNLSIQVVDEVKKHFRAKVYQTIIPRNVRLSEAPSHGEPIIIYDPRSKGAEVYIELAKEVMDSE